MKSKKIYASILVALCVVMTMVLVSCAPDATDISTYNEIVAGNIALKGYTLDSVSVDTATTEETGSVKKSVTVDGTTATTIVSEKKLKSIVIDGANTGRYEITETAPVTTADYTGESLKNDLTYENLVLEGSSLVVTETDMTLTGTVADIAKTLVIADTTGITQCTLSVVIDIALKTVKSYVIEYTQGTTTTTLTYTQVA